MLGLHPVLKLQFFTKPLKYSRQFIEGTRRLLRNEFNLRYASMDLGDSSDEESQEVGADCSLERHKHGGKVRHILKYVSFNKIPSSSHDVHHRQPIRLTESPQGILKVVNVPRNGRSSMSLTCT